MNVFQTRPIVFNTVQFNLIQFNSIQFRSDQTRPGQDRKKFITCNQDREPGSGTSDQGTTSAGSAAEVSRTPAATSSVPTEIEPRARPARLHLPKHHPSRTSTIAPPTDAPTMMMMVCVERPEDDDDAGGALALAFTAGAGVPAASAAFAEPVMVAVTPSDASPGVACRG